MAQIYKDHTQLEISCPAAKFFEVFTSKSHLLPKICPAYIQNCDIIKGDGTTIGSAKFWKIIREPGTVEIAKDEIQAIDLLNKSVTLKVTEGAVLEYYKTMNVTISVTTEGGKTFVNLDIEYEKLNEAYPAPTAYLEFFAAYTKDINSYFSKP